jgi:hypothetical protein
LKVVSICERRDVAYFGTDSGDLTKVTEKFTGSLFLSYLISSVPKVAKFKNITQREYPVKACVTSVK